MNGSIMLEVWGLNKSLGEVDEKAFRFIGKGRYIKNGELLWEGK